MIIVKNIMLMTHVLLDIYCCCNVLFFKVVSHYSIVVVVHCRIIPRLGATLKECLISNLKIDKRSN